MPKDTTISRSDDGAMSPRRRDLLALVAALHASAAGCRRRRLSDIADGLDRAAHEIEFLDLIISGKSPCGHFSAYAVKMDEPGHLITCLQCRAESAEVSLTTIRTENTVALRLACEFGFLKAEEGYNRDMAMIKFEEVIA